MHADVRVCMTLRLHHIYYVHVRVCVCVCVCARDLVIPTSVKSMFCERGLMLSWSTLS